MTLLDDLRALDLSSVLDAKVDISATVDGDALQALVSSGAASSVLGELGAVLDAAVHDFEDPEALVAPILALLGDLLGSINVDDLPLAAYVEAIIEGTRLVAGLIEVVSGDPRAISSGGVSLGDALERLGGPVAEHALRVGSGLSTFRALVESVERGLPNDPSALVGQALQILVSVPTDQIDHVRGMGATIQGRLDQLTISTRLTEGLVAALVEVGLAARADDRARLEGALASLVRVRNLTVDQLAEALRRLTAVVSGLHVAQDLQAVRNLRGLLASADDSAFALLDGWRDMIAQMRGVVAQVDPAVALTQAVGILDLVESRATEFLNEAVDQSVEVVKQKIRDLMREIPLRSLRQDLSAGIAAIAAAVADADLDAPIEAVRGGIVQVSELLAQSDPAALVQAAVDQLVDVLSEAMDSLEDAMGRVTSGIASVAAQAQQVLQRAVDGLRDFKDVAASIEVTIGQAGITEAADEIAAKLHELREQVSTLLSDAPLPDALRESVAQLVDLLSEIDVDAAVGQPLREVAAALQIPDDVATTVHTGLQAVADTASALVPTDVIAELEEMMQGLLDEIQNLDLGRLTSGISAALTEAAAAFEGVDLVEMLAPATEVFDEVVSAVDRVHPRLVLAPVINLYGDILGRVPLPDPQTLANHAATVASAAGEALGRAAAEPARQAVDKGATAAPATGGAPGGPSPAREEPPEDLRIGDIVRLIGFLPAKLRETLDGMEAGPAGQVLSQVDDTFSGTARELRDLRDQVTGLESSAGAAFDAAVAAVTPAQVDAQLALEGSAVLRLDGFDVDASIGLLASVGPAGLQQTLAGDLRQVTSQCRAAAAELGGELASDLEHAADLLDAMLPSALTQDLDAFLAALDPEPIAAELDGLMADVVALMPGFLVATETELRDLETRIRRLIAAFNPGVLAQRYLSVLDVVREELALLDPGRLADELGEVHAQLRSALTAYDPGQLAAELNTLLVDVAAAVRRLDPAQMIPNLGGIGVQVDRAIALLPAEALAGIGTELADVGNELRELDVHAMLDAVNSVSPQLAGAIDTFVETVRDELVALLESLQYAKANASASVGVHVG